MIINNITGERYASRKEAKDTLGHSIYNKMVRNSQFTFINANRLSDNINQYNLIPTPIPT